MTHNCMHVWGQLLCGPQGRSRHMHAHYECTRQRTFNLHCHVWPAIHSSSQSRMHACNEANRHRSIVTFWRFPTGPYRNRLSGAPSCSSGTALGTVPCCASLQRVTCARWSTRPPCSGLYTHAGFAGRCLDAATQLPQ